MRKTNFSRETMLHFFKNFFSVAKRYSFPMDLCKQNIASYSSFLFPFVCVMRQVSTLPLLYRWFLCREKKPFPTAAKPPYATAPLPERFHIGIVHYPIWKSATTGDSLVIYTFLFECARICCCRRREHITLPCGCEESSTPPVSHTAPAG